MYAHPIRKMQYNYQFIYNAQLKNGKCVASNTTFSTKNAQPKKCYVDPIEQVP